MRENQECKCQRCQNDIDFDIDEFLINEIRLRNVVIFAGAGVSTENPNSAPHSFYTELAIKIGKKDRTLPFPDIAQEYSQRPDGRFELLKRILERFDYVYKFADLREEATRFYRELATMPYLETFITTNWDRNFEEICQAKPFVYDPDMRFWEIPDRKVLKIHGTIDDYSSLIVTRDDYDQCSISLQSSLIGAKLKDLLTTKTCIFIGFSMNDDDFRDIFEFVRTGQGQFEKTHYFVNPSLDDGSLYGNIKAIRTDGTYFLNVIKQHLCFMDDYLDDDIYDQVQQELYDVQEEHSELWKSYNPKEYPQMLASAIYQDGLIHGYQLIRDMEGAGCYSDPSILYAKIQGYSAKIADLRSKRNYLDIAYFSGFLNTLIALDGSIDLDHVPFPPRYYFEKVHEMNRCEFEEVLEELPSLHKGAFRQCKKAISNLPADGTMVIHHRAWG